MRNTMKTAILIMSLPILFQFSLFAQTTPDSQKPQGQNDLNTPEKMPEKPDEKSKVQENQKEANKQAGESVQQTGEKQQNAQKNKSKEKSSETISKTKKPINKPMESQVIKKEPKKIEGNILKNPELTQELKISYFDEGPVDRIALYLFYGMLSGGLMGMGGGLSFYTTSANLTPLFLSAGAVGAAGAITGVVVALIENSTQNPLIGIDLLQYSWYGVVGGALIGGIAGLIPYSSTNNIATLLNWVGYGSFAGLGAGVALFFLLPKSTLKNIIIDTNPIQPKIGYKFMF